MKFLINKKLIMLAILLACLLTVSAVSAADNATESVKGTDDAKEVVGSINDDVMGVGETQIVERENIDVLSSNGTSFGNLTMQASTCIRKPLYALSNIQ